MSHTKIENFGIETRAGNCGSLLCSSNENYPDQEQLEFVDPSESENENGQNIGKKKKGLRLTKVPTVKKVFFKDFVQVMSYKMEDSKMRKEDVIFEDQERNVSCFLW